MPNRITIDLTGLSQAKKDKIADAFGFNTADEIADFLQDYFVSELKARLVYKAKSDARASASGLNLD